MSRNIVALYLFSFFMIMPVVGLFPALPLIRDDLGLSYSQVSFFVACLGLVRICLAFPSGFLADRFDNKKILVLSGTLTVSGLILMGVSHSIYHLILSRVLIGAGSILSSITVLVLLAQLARPDRKGMIMSMNNVVHSSGHIVSSALVGVVTQLYHWRASFFLLAGFTLVSCVLILALFSPGDRTARSPDDLPGMTSKGDREGRGNAGAWFRLAPVFTVSFFAFFYRGSFRHTLIPFYGRDVFNIGVMELGFYISLTGLISIGSFLAFGILSDRFGRRQVTLLGLSFTFLSLVALVLPAYLHPFLLSCLLVGLGTAINSMPNILISDFTPRGTLGRVMGVNRVFSNSGYFIGASLSGVMLDYFGFRVPLYILMAFCLLVLLLTLRTIRDRG